MINEHVSYRDKIVKQSCYFGRMCDHELKKKRKKKKQTRVNLFPLQLCVHEHLCWGLLLEALMAIARSWWVRPQT